MFVFFLLGGTAGFVVVVRVVDVGGLTIASSDVDGDGFSIVMNDSCGDEVASGLAGVLAGDGAADGFVGVGRGVFSSAVVDAGDGGFSSSISSSSSSSFFFRFRGLGIDSMVRSIFVVFTKRLSAAIICCSWIIISSGSWPLGKDQMLIMGCATVDADDAVVVIAAAAAAGCWLHILVRSLWIFLATITDVGGDCCTAVVVVDFSASVVFCRSADVAAVGDGVVVWVFGPLWPSGGQGLAPEWWGWTGVDALASRGLSLFFSVASTSSSS